MNPLPFLRSLTPHGWLLSGIIALAAAVVIYFTLGAFFAGTAKVEADLATEQADAAIASGQDAVKTVGDQAETETERERQIDDLEKELDDAENASDAHTAGIGWLCANFGICGEN